MNLEHEEKCHITFPSNKATAHALTELAHLQGITQPQLLQQICEAYIDEKIADIMKKIPQEMLYKIQSEE